MNDASCPVEVLRPLLAKTAVTTPIGIGTVWAQTKNHVTVLVGRVVAVFERWQVEDVAALRGLGRNAYRLGFMVQGAISFAADHVGRELSADERLAVLEGWRAERSEVSL